MRRQLRGGGIPCAQLKHRGQAAAAQHHAPSQSADQAAGMPRQAFGCTEERGLHPQRSSTLGRLKRRAGSVDTGMRPAQHRGNTAEWKD